MGWIQSPFVAATSLAPTALDSTASDFNPDGVGAAGSLTVAAAGDHVHPGKAHQELYLGHSGTLAETFPRLSALATPATGLTSGTVYCSAIPLAKGITVTNISLITGAASQNGGSHGWFALLDSTLTVRAVSGDQTGNTFFTGSTLFTLPMGVAFPVVTAGLYYIAMSVTSSIQMPSFTGTVAAATTTAVGSVGGPVLYGTAGTQNAPPALSAQLNSGNLTVATAAQFYAYVS